MLTKFSGCFYTDRLTYLSAQTEWRREGVTLANIVDWYFAGHNCEDGGIDQDDEDDDVDHDEEDTLQVTMVKMIYSRS